MTWRWDARAARYRDDVTGRFLGAGRVRVFFGVTLPLLRPALVGAALLTFMSSGASFSAPLLFGDDYPMLTVRIFEERELHHDAEAAIQRNRERMAALLFAASDPVVHPMARSTDNANL